MKQLLSYLLLLLLLLPRTISSNSPKCCDDSFLYLNHTCSDANNTQILTYCSKIGELVHIPDYKIEEDEHIDGFLRGPDGTLFSSTSYCLSQVSEDGLPPVPNSTLYGVVCATDSSYYELYYGTIHPTKYLNYFSLTVFTVCYLFVLLVYYKLSVLQSLQDTIVRRYLLFSLLSTVVIYWTSAWSRSYLIVGSPLLYYILYFALPLLVGPVMGWFNTLAFDSWKNEMFLSGTDNTDKLYRSYRVWAYGAGVFHALQFTLTKAAYIANRVVVDHHSQTRDNSFFLLSLQLTLLIWTAVLARENNKLRNTTLRRVTYQRFMVSVFILDVSIYVLELVRLVNSFSLQKTIVADVLMILHGVVVVLFLIVLRNKVLTGMAEEKVLGINWPRKWVMLQDDEPTFLMEDAEVDQPKPETLSTDGFLRIDGAGSE